MMVVENNSSYDLHSIYMGMTKINYLFGDNPSVDDYLDNALNCLRQIGNMYPRIEAINGKTDNQGKLCLPVRAFKIESVTVPTVVDRIEDSLWINSSNLHGRGFYNRYEFYGDHIISTPNTNLQVIYRTFVHDDEGLPMITESEAEACAYWWKWIDTRRKLYQGNQLAMSILPLVEKDKNKAVNQARVDISEGFSQNFMNQYLDVLSSSNRKRFNVPYKPYTIS
jgi:hypothetical protein